MAGFLRRLIVFGALFVLVAELMFRFVVPGSRPPFHVQDPEHGVFHFEAAAGREGRFTVGRLARERTRWRVNDAGWNSHREYLAPAARQRPCVAVIGNSYVEGFYADVDSGLTAALERELGRDDVYNFGVSGVKAPQMVRIARYAQQHFAPEAFVFVLTHGSLSSALRDFGFAVHNAQYRWDDGRLPEVPPSAYRANRLLRMHVHSALLRYMYYNAQILKSRAAARQEAVQRAETPDPVTAAQQDAMFAAVARRVVADVRSELPRATVLFVMDADRRRMVDTGARPDPLRDSPYWDAACREAGCGYLDLTDAFWDAYRTDRRPVDFADNYHWNQHGMAVVARAIAGRLRAPLAMTGGAPTPATTGAR